MNNDHFQKLMQKWLNRELQEVPELHPTAAMYKLLQENAQKKRTGFKFSNWYLAAAAMLLVAFLTISNYERIFYPAPPAVAELETRSDVKDKDEIAFEKSFQAHKEMGVAKGGAREEANDEVMFHFQREGSFFATEVDMSQQLEHPVGLKQEDNYRISVKPAADSYLYVFQLNSEGDLIKLFPKEEENMVNPLSASQMIMLPDQEKWYHLDEKTGEETIYLCLRREKLDDLIEMYNKYTGTRSASRRKKDLNKLLEYLNNMDSRTMLLDNQ